MVSLSLFLQCAHLKQFKILKISLILRPRQDCYQYFYHFSFIGQLRGFGSFIHLIICLCMH